MGYMAILGATHDLRFQSDVVVQIDSSLQLAYAADMHDDEHFQRSGHLLQMGRRKRKRKSKEQWYVVLVHYCSPEAETRTKVRIMHLIPWLCKHP